MEAGLWAHTGSGDVEVSGKPLAAWKVEAGSGNATVDTSGAPMSLNATTGSGDLNYAGGGLKQTGGGDKQHLVGEANGGGPAVRVTTGSGNISVK